MCLCALLTPVDNQTGVLVLQHPRERLHPIGTARLATLGLRKVRVEVAWNAGRREYDPPAWLPAGTALLYPSDSARELETLPGAQHPSHLLVLDGTWHTASGLYRDKVWLQRLPHVRLVPRAPSRYRLRLEPEQHCVSTIEAIVAALQLLEPQTTGLSDLLAAFDAMIDDQLAHVRRRVGRPYARKRRPAPQRRIPEVIVEGLARLVIVYAESSRASLHGERELVQLTARALGSGAELQRQLIPAAGLPSPALLSHMQLTRADFTEAVSLATLREQWPRFIAQQHRRPVIAAWNQSSFDLLAAAGLQLPERLLLKSAYRGRCGTEQASLEDVIAAAALSPRAGQQRGRAAWRVACAEAVARHLHALQRADPRPVPDNHSPRSGGGSAEVE
jgi:DTW domain-containing protein